MPGEHISIAAAERLIQSEVAEFKRTGVVRCRVCGCTDPTAFRIDYAGYYVDFSDGEDEWYHSDSRMTQTERALHYPDAARSPSPETEG